MSRCIAMQHTVPKRRVPPRLLVTLVWVLSLPRLCRARRPGLKVSSAAQEMAYAERLEVPLGAAIAGVRRLQVDGVEECTEDTSVGDAEAGIAIYYDEEACDREDPLVGCNVLLRNNCRLCIMNDEEESYLPTCPDYVTEYVEEMYPQITETLAPTVAGSPLETPTPVTTMAPVMTTAPATAVPISTLAPGETMAPQETYSPLSTAAPGQTLAPGVTFAPVVTLAPGVTLSPASTMAPALTLAPASTPSPATTPSPSLAAATLAPGTLSPMATLSPTSGTVAPHLTQAPSFTPPPSGPTVAPSTLATVSPSLVATLRPTSLFSAAPTSTPTASPTSSHSPTSAPTASPTFVPTASPTFTPTGIPTSLPTMSPTASPTASPTMAPTPSVLAPEPGSLVGSLTVVSDEVPSCEAGGTCEVVIGDALEEIFGKSNGTVEVTNVTVASVEGTGRRRLSGDQRGQYYLRGARRLQEIETQTTVEFVTSPEEASDLSESEQAADQINILAGGGVTTLLEKLGLPLDSEVSDVYLSYTQVGSPSTEETSEFRELAIALYEVEDGSSDLTAAEKLAMAAGLAILVLATVLLFLLCCWLADKRPVMAKKKVGAKEFPRDDDDRQSVYTNITETSTRTQAARKKLPQPSSSAPHPTDGSPDIISGGHEDLEASLEPAAASKKISEEEVFFCPPDGKESPSPGPEPAQKVADEKKPQPDGPPEENQVFCATGLLGDSPRFGTAREKAVELRSRSSSASMDTKPGGSAPLPSDTSPVGVVAGLRALRADFKSAEMQGGKTPEFEDEKESAEGDSAPGFLLAGEAFAALGGLSKRDEVRSPRSSTAPMTSLVTVIEEPSAESTPEMSTLDPLEGAGDDGETPAEGMPKQRERSDVLPGEDDAQGSSTGSESLLRRVEPLVATSPSSQSTMSPAIAAQESPVIPVPIITASGSSTGAGVGGADGGGDSMHSTDSGSTSELVGIGIATRETQSPSRELSPSLDPSPHARGFSPLSVVPEEVKATEPALSSMESEGEEKASTTPSMLSEKLPRDFSPVRGEAPITQAPLSSPMVPQPRGKEPTPHDSSERVHWEAASYAASSGSHMKRSTEDQAAEEDTSPSPPRTETPQHYRRVVSTGGSPGQVWVTDDAQIDDEFGSETTGTSSRTVGTPSSPSATSSAPAPAPTPAHQRWIGGTRRPGQGPTYYMESSAASHREAKSQSELKQSASLRVHDAGPSPFIRLSSSQSTEAPSTNRSQTVVAQSPDGVGYLFSRSGMRGYSMRRQSSSFSSYASFGVPSDQGGTGGTSRAASAYGTDEDGDAFMEDTTGQVTQTGGARESGESSGGSLIAVRQEAKQAYDAMSLLQQPSAAVPAPSLTGRLSRKDSATPGGGPLLGLQPTGVEGQRRIREGQSVDDALGPDVGGGRTSESESGVESAGLSGSVGLSESVGLSGSARLSGSSGFSSGTGSIWDREEKGPGRRAGEGTSTGGKRPRQAELDRKDDVKKEKSDPEASELPSWLSTGAKASETEGAIRSRSSGVQGVAVHSGPHAVEVSSGDSGVDPSRPTMIEHDEEEVQY